jgi:flagellar basal-body rod protein FlgC
MSDILTTALAVSASGMAAQSTRLRVISENVANSGTAGQTPGADPYQRKTIAFSAVVDPELGTELVKVDAIGRDTSPFRTEYNPSHPAAGDDGMVKLPNVELLVEVADMREAVRNYEANVEAYKQARGMIAATIDLLRS